MGGGEKRHVIPRSSTELIQLQVLVAVIETGSFNGASRRLGFSAPSISRHVSHLEHSLGAKLIQRTTRSLSVTESGANFYARARHILEELASAEAEAANQNSDPRGRLKVAMPNVFAMRFIRPRLAEFMRAYPHVALEMILTSERIDMLREGIDLSIQTSSDVDIKATPGFTAIRLASVEIGIFSSPSYLERNGLIDDPMDLLNHNCLCGRTNTYNSSWPIYFGKDIRFIRVSGTLVADHGGIILEAVKEGLGVALLPLHLVREALESGDLVPILPDRIAQTSILYGIVPDREFLPKKTRSFIEFVRNCTGSVLN